MLFRSGAAAYREAAGVQISVPAADAGDSQQVNGGVEGATVSQNPLLRVWLTLDRAA